MLDRWLAAISEEYRRGAAFEYVAKISGFHRIQASPGFRAAAEYVFRTMRSLGVDAEILSFPADGETRWWTQPSFKEWACDDAELVLTEGGKRELLCSFQEEKISLIQRSAPTAPGGADTSIVYIQDATEPASYEGKQVQGRLVFSRGDVQAIAAVAVDKLGALGVVVDNMNEFPPVRDRMDVPDARQYTSFWPGDAPDFRALGFVLSPRQGENLRKMFTPERPEVKAFARVDSRFYVGGIEDVTAVIPGETREEVVAVAHLCHPQNSANDNASGSGALMEAARTLSALVKAGRLPKPRRTIRFLWVPEMAGSYMYLASNEDKIPEAVAAINLDMVGENQDLCKGPFLVERPPKAGPGFGGDLAESILRAIAKEAANLAGTSSYGLFKWAVTPFSGGSDHYIWADPTVGVTCPMLIQWPDRYYHTSQDTIDKVDPKMLHVAGTLAATYLYFAACAGAPEAALLAKDMAAHLPGEIDDALSATLKVAVASTSSAGTPEDALKAVAGARRTLERRAEFLGDRKAADVSALTRLGGNDPALRSAQEEAVSFARATASFFKTKSLAELSVLAGCRGVEGLPAPLPDDPGLAARARSMVPLRLFRGPLASRGVDLDPKLQAEYDDFARDHRSGARSLIYIQYWADGKRDLLTIADLIEGETGNRDLRTIVEYTELMAKCGFFRLR